MNQKIHRFSVGYDGDVLEIVNPTELKVDKDGALIKAVWFNEKGEKQILEWDENEKKYHSTMEKPPKRPKRPKDGHQSN